MSDLVENEVVEDVSVPVPNMESEEVEEVIVESLSDEDDGSDKEEVDIAEILRQNEELKQKADSTGALASSFDNLAEKLSGGVQQPVQQPSVSKPTESAADFKKRISKELFGKDPMKALEEYNTRFAEEQIAPVLQQNKDTIGKLQRKLMANDPIMQKYGDDVNRKLDMMTPAQKSHPDALEWAIKEVKIERQDDIIAERVAEEVAKQLGGKQGGEKKRSNYVEGDGYNRKPPAKKVVKILPGEAEEIDRLMTYRGLSKEVARGIVIRKRNGRNR